MGDLSMDQRTRLLLLAKEQQERIEALEAELEERDQRIDELEAKLAEVRESVRRCSRNE